MAPRWPPPARSRPRRTWAAIRLRNAVVSDKTVNLTINTATTSTTAASYNCVEGSFLAGVGAQWLR